MVTVILTVLVFMIIIITHEFGHFIAAKSVGVLVHEFSIGFGPAIFKKQGKETLYVLRAIPFGGFVKLEGEDEDSDDPRSLNNKPAWKRLVVMAAGAVFNLVTGLLVFLFIYMSMPKYNSLEVAKFTDDIPNAPAKYVMEVGDEIKAVNGKRVWNFNDFSFVMSMTKTSQELDVTVERDGRAVDLKITPVKYDGRYVLGFQVAQKDMTLPAAIKLSFAQTVFIIKVVIYSFMMLVTGGVSMTEMSGPIGTGKVIGSAAKSGFFSLAQIFALLAVNVGVFNLIPFPALDGGRIFFLLIEMITRKKLPPEKEGMIHMIGFMLLIVLMIFVTSSDIYKLFMPKG